MTAFWFVRANALLLVGGIWIEGLAWTVSRGTIPPAVAKRFSYGFLISVLVFPFLSGANSSLLAVRPAVQVWSAPTMRAASSPRPIPIVSVAPLSATAPAAVLKFLGWFLLLGALGRFSRSARRNCL